MYFCYIIDYRCIVHEFPYNLVVIGNVYTWLLRRLIRLEGYKIFIVKVSG